MKNIDTFEKFIIEANYSDERIQELSEYLLLTNKQLIKKSFKYLNYIIGNIQNNLYYETLINNAVNLIYHLCNNEEFTKEEVVINRDRIKKSRNAILAYSNKFKSESLLDSANILDQIVLDKSINVEDLIVLLKELIDRKEDINIIKKFLNTNKGVIILDKNVLFDYAFELAMQSIINNTADIYYYIALLKIFYSTKIDKEYYIRNLNSVCDDKNSFGNEIYEIIHGNKKSLSLEEISSKYGIITNLKSAEILLPRKRTTNETIITIDDIKTKLRDDAISLTKDGNNYIIGIHISDPGRFIIPNSLVDTQAKNNYKNVYLSVNGPRLLSPLLENKFSLDTGRVKPVISLYVIINESADIIDYYIRENDIIINENLSYEQADQLIMSNHISDRSKLLKQFYEITKMLSSKNHIKNDYWNKKQEEDKNKELHDYKSDKLVSELMVLYNNLLAIIACNESIPYIYRTQNSSYLKSLALKLNIDIDDELEKIIKSTYLTSIYSSIPMFHHGLNISIYSHSADPLRRYPDLNNQYLLHLFHFKDINYDFNYDNHLELVDYCNQRSTELSLMRAEYIRARKLIKRN